MKENNKYIYIVLVKALTGLGKFARRFSKYEYTHIAVCLNDDLDDFVTFSRRYHYAPFDSGFMHETLDCYAFGENESVKLKVFRLPVKEENMARIEEFISQISGDEDYLFNLHSMATMTLFHGFRIYKAYNCMSFVSRIIELSECVEMKKKYFKYNIKDTDELLTDYLFKEENFTKTKIEKEDYMKKVGCFKNAGMFIRLNTILTVRFIFKSPKKSDL